MPDISKIKIEDDVYNIKDEEVWRLLLGDDYKEQLQKDKDNDKKENDN